MKPKKSSLSFCKIMAIVALGYIGLCIIYPPLLFVSIYTPLDLLSRYERAQNEERQSRLMNAKLERALLKAQAGEPLAQLFVANYVGYIYSGKPEFIKLMADIDSRLTTEAEWALYWLEQAVNGGYGPAFCYKSRLGSTVRYDYSNEERELWLRKAVELGNPKSLSPIILWKYYLFKSDYQKATDVLIEEIRKDSIPSLIQLSNEYFSIKRSLENVKKYNHPPPDSLQVKILQQLPTDIEQAILELSAETAQKYNSAYVYTDKDFDYKKTMGQLWLDGGQFKGCIAKYDLADEYDLFRGTY